MKKENVIKLMQLINVAIVVFFIAACGNSASQKENSLKNDKKVSVENSTSNVSDIQTKEISLNSEEVNANPDMKIDSRTKESDTKNALTVDQQIKAAKKEGKAVFLLVTDSNNQDVENAESMANSAKNKVSGSLVVKVNRDVSENNSFVNELGISNVPVPFFVVYSRKGLPVSGVPFVQANVDLLTKSVPSPKQDEVLVSLSEKKPVFIIIYKKENDDRSLLASNCKTASSKLSVSAGLVEIDFSDSKETDFLKQIGVTSVTSKSKTVVVNSVGQITDVFEGIITVDNLVASVNKVVKGGGCCPAGGGGAKGC